MVTIEQMIQTTPTLQQVKYQDMEFIGFIHFGINTFYDNEWGDGSEDPAQFNPTQLDCHQWVHSLKAAGMTGIILTCKHHDGFCLWPSKYTNHSVASSPWREGQGDVVKEFSNACQAAGVKFGVYLSPWDQAEPSYGSGQAYDDFFVNQLEELLTNYGDVFEVWFDGANGEGPNGKKQVYDWQRYYQVIRDLQPNAVIAICGPDVRWVGNEAGKSRENEWSVVPIEYSFSEYTAERSQQEDDHAFREAYDTMDEDLGSTQKLQNYNGELIWYPAEVDTSIRPGWFYHEYEDDQVRSAEKLFDIYKTSVGGNATLLLNVPPTTDGLIADADIQELTKLGEYIQQLKSQTLIEQADIYFSSNNESNNIALLDIASRSSYWMSDVDDFKPIITLTWQKPVEINFMRIKEYIEHSQRVEQFTIRGYLDQVQQFEIQSGVIGYQNIIDIPKSMVDKVTIEFNQYRGESLFISGLDIGRME